MQAKPSAAAARRGEGYAAFHRLLLAWYNRYGRKDLPWRNTRDAYAIYLSEVMLQQTQVKTVLERFYVPFLTRFPSLRALAEAPQDEVLSAWQGLGYYSRALNLHKAAKASAAGLPADVEALRALPGVGKNTAHAVAAFAFHQPVAVMEANVRRVLCRIFAISKPVEADLWEKAAALLDASHPFDYNQAMMDVGATVCTKRAPACAICPAQAICRGKDAPELYPAAKMAKKVPVRRETIWVLRNEAGEFYAAARASRFLGGLYQFAQSDAEATGLRVGKHHFARAHGKTLGVVRQQYSHFTLEADVMLLEAGKAGGKDWYGPRALLGLPMSMAEKKVMGLLGLSGGGGDG